jgi:hypothetical protein
MVFFQTLKLPIRISPIKLLFVLLSISLICGCASKDDSNPRSDSPDDSQDDDDPIITSDDASGDDTDEAAIQIRSPRSGYIYYSSSVLLVVSREILEDGGRLTLDGGPLPSRMIQWIVPGDGAHVIESIAASGRTTRSSFTVRAGDNTAYPAQQTTSLPNTISFPAAQASSTPVRLRIRNEGAESVKHLGIRSADQPDFRTMENLRDYLLDATAGMTPEQTALYLFHFLERWAYIGKPAYEWGYGGDQAPAFFTMWGYGECGNFANMLPQLSQLIGWPAENTRPYALEGHVVTELFYDDDWHLFDPMSVSYYWNDAGKILQVRDIEQDPESILDYTDDYGYSLGWVPMVFLEQCYASPSDNAPTNTILDEGPQFDLTVEAGDVIDFYPWGFGNWACIMCEGDPLFVGTGVLSRTLTPVTSSYETLIELPYPVTGLNISVEWVEGRPGNLLLDLTLNGSLADMEKTISISSDSSPSTHDLTQYFTEKLIGAVTKVSIRFDDPDASAGKISLEAYFQFNPRMFPQIDHDHREILVEGVGGELSLELEVFDAIDPVADATLDSQSGVEVPTLQSDGRRMISLFATPRRADGFAASGHLMNLQSDHPDDVEILTSPRTGMNQVEPVPTPWSGPSRVLSTTYSSQIYFVRSRGKRGDDIGPVEFIFTLDGNPAAMKTIDFVAAE